MAGEQLRCSKTSKTGVAVVLMNVPPLGELSKYPVVTGVGVAAVVSTLARWAGWDGDAFFLDVRAWNGQFWRLVTATLLHVDLFHLAFNVYWLLVFGTVVERVFRPLRTAGIFLLFAIGSSAAQYAIDEPGVGLSGVGYGLFGLLLVLDQRDPRFAGTMDRRTDTLFLGWFLFCWVMTRNGLWRVGNAAHASGAVLGLLLGLAVTTRGARRVGAAAALCALLILALVGASTATPSAEELAYLGYQDLENDRNELAAERYQRAVERNPSQADWWLNLGIARQRLGRAEEAAEAYRRGLALRPQNRELREGLRGAKSEWAYRLHIDGDYAGAVTLYRELLADDEGSALIWYNLGLAYQAMGQVEPAREAMTRAAKLDPADKRFRDALLGLNWATERKK